MSKRIIADGFTFDDKAAKERLRCKIKAQRTRDKRKAAGLCTTCGKPSRVPDCGSCKRARREKRLERKRNNQCVSCAKPNVNGKDQCDDCNSKEYTRYAKSRLTEEGRRRELTNQMRHLYGITYEEYEELAAQQNHVCEICRQGRNRKGQRLFVDHDHDTGVLRGLLCQNCNSVLGLAHDSPEVLRQAAEYIEKYRENKEK